MRQTAIIFAHGSRGNPEKALALCPAPDFIVCADGGALHAISLGLTPAVIIGDFDSLDRAAPDLSPALEAKGSKLLRFPIEKDYSDLELALEFALEQKVSSLLVLGAFGGRIDHEMCNLFLCARPRYSAMNIRLSDGLQTANIMHGPQSIELEATTWNTFSLIPLSPAVSGVTIRGAKWPLEGETLDFGSTRSLSNRAAESRVKVSVGEGILVVVTIEEDFE